MSVAQAALVAPNMRDCPAAVKVSLPLVCAHALDHVNGTG
jgi:hypothetical protein